MKKRRFLSGIGLVRRRGLAGYLFILPWMLGFMLFFGRFFIQTFTYAFSRITFPVNSTYQVAAVGFQNFTYALTQHATFNRTLFQSIGNMLIDVPLILAFSLFMAVLINRKFHGRTTLRAILFLPVIMTTPAIVSILSTSLLDIASGMSSGASAASSQSADGLNAQYLIAYLTDFGVPKALTDYIISAISRVYDIVRHSGVQILIFLAALQAISPAIYEVAQIEGATSYEAFWKITFPLVSPMILTNMVYTVITLYTETPVVTMVYETAFAGQLNFGLSAAMSLISIALMSLVLFILYSLVSSRVFYQS